MYGIYLKKDDGNYKRVAYSQTKEEAKRVKGLLEVEEPDGKYIVEKLKW